MDPIDCAEKGDTEFFKQVASIDVFLNSRDEKEGDSVFSVAVHWNHLDCSKAIFKRCPSLLYQQSTQHKYTALHHAGWRGEVTMVKFLIDAAAETVGAIPGYKKLFRLVDIWGQTGLHKAVIQQNLETVKLLIEEDRDHALLRMADGNKVTALHLAVESRNREIVKVLIEADPQSEYCANNSGDTPLMIAMRDKEAPLPGNSDCLGGEMEPLIVGPWGGQEGRYWRLVNGDSNVRRIMRILIDHGQVIDSINFEFEDGETGRVMYRAFGGGRGNNNFVIDLDSSQEYFTNIRGHVGVFNGGTLTVVSSLTFETNLRTYGPFGTEQGTAFSTSLQNAKIVGFHGRCGRYLHSIGVYAVAQW